MGLSRLEVNLKRLLIKCELMAKNNQKDDERFPKYISSLSEMLKSLEDTSDSSNLMNYSQRIEALKEILLNQSKPESEIIPDARNPNISDIPNPKQLSPREELLGTESNIRQRSTKGTGDLDALLDYHRKEQDKIAENMLSLTRSLKEQSQLANRIIKQDTDTMNNSSQITDQNFAKLKTESEKLSEHSRRACKCWMWIMLIIVMVLFINMVLFMKVMKKKV